MSALMRFLGDEKAALRLLVYVCAGLQLAGTLAVVAAIAWSD